MVLLLPSAWLACFLLFRELAASRRIEQDWRFAFMLASATWGAVLTLSTEILSLAISINAASVLIFWLCVNASLWGAWLIRRRRSPSEGRGWASASGLKTWWSWPLDARLLLGAAMLFAVFLGGIALLTPTTNWDSLTYHLARVMHWIQNQTIAHFPTNMIAQIQMGPWSAFAQTHLWLLWGGDRFANMVQWSAMFGCMVVATLLVRQLLPSESEAAGARAQAFAAVLVVSLPTGIVESITTQTDYTGSFWLMCFASLSLAWCRQPENRIYAAAAGAVLGLGLLTKITILIFAAPVGLAATVALVWRQRLALAKVVVPGTFALAVCFALVLPHSLRNQLVFGSAIGSKSAQEGLGMRHLSLSGILFNVLHNVELHSNTGIEPLTHQLNRLVQRLEGWTGRQANDRELSTPSGLSFETSVFHAPDEFYIYDSFAASPWHVLLMGVAAIAGLAGGRRNWRAMTGLALAMAGFVLFCATLRWGFWNSRYHLPTLVLSMPMVAALLVPRTFRWGTCVGAAGLLAIGMVIVGNNLSRPVFDPAWRAQPRFQQMFSSMGVAYCQPTRDVVAQIMAADCQEVGLKLWADAPEYPLWLALREAGFKGRIYHVLVDGPSARLPEAAGMPDVIVASPPGRPVGDLAVRYPIATKITGPGENGAISIAFTLYWSEKISERRTQLKQLTD